MHRPTRQNKNLEAKIQDKSARSRRRGNKAKRWAKWVETYKGLCQDGAKEAS